MSALASQPHFASLSLLGVKAVAWRAGVQHRIGQSPRCEYRAHATKCLERCLPIGSPVQTEIKLLLQIHRALAKRSVGCPDLRFQPLLLQKLHCWLFLLSVLSARTQAGRECCPLGCPCAASMQCIRGKSIAWLRSGGFPSRNRSGSHCRES